MVHEQQSEPWLPVGSALLALAIISLGLQQAYVGNLQPFWWWLFLPMCSPRLKAKYAYVPLGTLLVGGTAFFWAVATAPPRPVPTAEEIRQRRQEEQTHRQEEQTRRYLCRVAAACRKYDEVRVECATAGTFKTCMRIKMGEDAGLYGSDDGAPAILPPGTPSRLDCLFLPTSTR
jgi:hypothetical protein